MHQFNMKCTSSDTAAYSASAVYAMYVYKTRDQLPACSRPLHPQAPSLLPRVTLSPVFSPSFQYLASGKPWLAIERRYGPSRRSLRPLNCLLAKGYALAAAKGCWPHLDFLIALSLCTICPTLFVPILC